MSFEGGSSEFDQLVDTESAPRLISSGHWWAEGPAWDATRSQLYFTDVPRNRAYVWRAGEQTQIFLDPSGVEPDQATGMREPGANGLLLGRSGELLICNHGKRRVEALDFASSSRRSLADTYDGKRFNSPNDIIEASDGTIYFTDPPYGLEGLNNSPLKELAVNGVYRIDRAGEVQCLIDDMTFPNGVVLSPDGRYLYVSQSDPEAPIVRRVELARFAQDKRYKGEVWFDARPFMQGVKGLPDGMAVAQTGHVFVAGPGGVLVVDPAGKMLGRINTRRATANCAFGEDGQTLFMTASDRVVAIRTKVRGVGSF